MKYFKVFTLVAILSLTTIAHAETVKPMTNGPAISKARRLGLGILLFGPTGLSASYFLSSKTSVDAALAWSMNDKDQNLYMHADYLFHKFMTLDNFPIRYYYGLGAHVVSWDDPPGKDRDPETRMGARIPLGIGHIFREPRIEVFGELAINVDLMPSTDADLTFGLGARYYF